MQQSNRDVLVKLAQTLLVKAIPNVNEAIGTARSKRAVELVERQGIDRVYLFDTVLLLAVTLERVLALLYLGTGVNVLHSHATFTHTHT